MLDGKIDQLKDGNGESCGLAGTGLSLGDGVVPSKNGHNATLLDGRWLFETIRVNTAKKVILQAHVIEVVHDLIPIGIQLLGFLLILGFRHFILVRHCCGVS
jgi:hypothetical protein